MKSTKPVFIIGSGRSGTRTFFRMLSGIQNIEIHHEYAVPHLQKIACEYYMGLISEREVESFLENNHSAAIFHSSSGLWADSSNKLVWIIKILRNMYPESRFLGIVRDGRKVVPSYYYKLREEMYDDASVKKVSDWLGNKTRTPAPPPEKKYWWNIPQPGQPWAEEFSTFSRFQRVCYHWANSNTTMLNGFKGLSNSNCLLVHLEDIKSDEQALKSCIDFIGLKYDPIFFEYLQTPRNVFYPMQYKMNQSQLHDFNLICSEVMHVLGYSSREEYHVEY
jgi:hypothetical protein